MSRRGKFSGEEWGIKRLNLSGKTLFERNTSKVCHKCEIFNLVKDFLAC